VKKNEKTSLVENSTNKEELPVKINFKKSNTLKFEIIG
jgi:hypothetical protein